MASNDTILCLNAGSSSLKMAVYAPSHELNEPVAHGAVEDIGLDRARLWVRDAGGRLLLERADMFVDHPRALAAALGAFSELSIPKASAIGHRVVHGGADYIEPARITRRLVEHLRHLVPFAPLHLPPEIAVIDAVMTREASMPQVACFDTAFHRRMPEVTQRFALPAKLWNQGVRRYGFHGLSYEYIISELDPPSGACTVIAHLGNGASMAAVRGRDPVDTTMGFTPAGGFMMGTRSGDLDPGILLHLLEHESMPVTALAHLVNHESGLLGVSGISSDMRTLLEQRAQYPTAALAVEMFCYQVRKTIGGLAAALGGLDTLVFTGGIGEHAAPVRELICRELGFLGITLDPALNAIAAGSISASDSRCAVRVIRTREDAMIARHTRRLVWGQPTGK